MNNKHLFSQFDSELSALSDHFLAMGAQVEQQIKHTLNGLPNLDQALIDEIYTQEQKIDEQEMEIDDECGRIIATRQPAARDLRFILAVSKAVAILERTADEVVRIVKHSKNIDKNIPSASIPYNDIAHLGEMALIIFHQALSAFAQQDGEAAHSLRLQDKAINEEFHKLRAKFISTMTANPNSIALFLDLLSIVKAIERIGDYAKKIGEYIIYVTQGTDIRHRKH